MVLDNWRELKIRQKFGICIPDIDITWTFTLSHGKNPIVTSTGRAHTRRHSNDEIFLIVERGPTFPAPKYAGNFSIRKSVKPLIVSGNNGLFGAVGWSPPFSFSPLCPKIAGSMMKGSMTSNTCTVVDAIDMTIKIIITDQHSYWPFTTLTGHQSGNVPEVSWD